MSSDRTIAGGIHVSSDRRMSHKCQCPIPVLIGGHYGRMAVDESKLNEFLGKAVGDLGAAMSATLILVGDRLGLYRELAKGAVTSGELAHRTGTNERYVREWLGNQGAGGYVEYDAVNDAWSLSPEQAL